MQAILPADIHTEAEIAAALKYGTQEHSAFLRRALPECGTVRA